MTARSVGRRRDSVRTSRRRSCEETMQMTVRWTTLSVLVAGVSAIRIINTSFPSHVIRGNSMNLSCDYETEGEKIYQVKWYKDLMEFYRYLPGTPAAGRSFSTPGVNVNVERSTNSSVFLESVDFSSEGTYVCEVTTDYPHFQTALARGSVTVIGLPQKGPLISGYFADSMDEGDVVWANCTVYKSRPAAELTWYINGARADSDHLRSYEPVPEADGLLTVTLAVSFQLRGFHFDPAGRVTLKCAAEIAPVFFNSTVISITRTTTSQPRAGSEKGADGASTSLPGSPPTAATPKNTVRSANSQPEPEPQPQPQPQSQSQSQPQSQSQSDGDSETRAWRASLRESHQRLLAVPPEERSHHEWRLVHQQAVCRIAEVLASRLERGGELSAAELAMAALVAPPGV